MRAIVGIVTPIIATEFVNVQQHTYICTYVRTYIHCTRGGRLSLCNSIHCCQLHSEDWASYNHSAILPWLSNQLALAGAVAREIDLKLSDIWYSFGHKGWEEWNLLANDNDSTSNALIDWDLLKPFQWRMWKCSVSNSIEVSAYQYHSSIVQIMMDD